MSPEGRAGHRGRGWPCIWVLGRGLSEHVACRLLPRPRSQSGISFLATSLLGCARAGKVPAKTLSPGSAYAWVAGLELRPHSEGSGVLLCVLRAWSDSEVLLGHPFISQMRPYQGLAQARGDKPPLPMWPLNSVQRDLLLTHLALTSQDREDAGYFPPGHSSVSDFRILPWVTCSPQWPQSLGAQQGD